MVWNDPKQCALAVLLAGCCGIGWAGACSPMSPVLDPSLDGGSVESGADAGPPDGSLYDGGSDAVVSDAGADASADGGLVTYVKASNTRADAVFGSEIGRSVVLAGDTLVVGSPLESSGATGIGGDADDTSAPESGAVYVFVKTAGTWAQQAYIKASNARAGAYFGAALAFTNDVLVVGSPHESSITAGNPADTTAPGAGAAYVFTRTGSTWTQSGYLKASNARAGAGFGSSVAVSGTTVAIGSPYETSNARNVGGDESNASVADAGAVYVFESAGTTSAWAQSAYVKASNTYSGAFFGWSVALSGTTLAVGSYGERSNAAAINGDQSDISAFAAGAVYVLTRGSATWSQQAYAKPSNMRRAAYFGLSVALEGDTLVVGSPRESSNATGVGGDQSNEGASEAGAVYAFTRAASTWSQSAYIKASNTRTNALFGWSVALSGDLLVVGSPYEASASAGIDGPQAPYTTVDPFNAGAAYSFGRSAGVWSQSHYFKATNTRAQAQFGGTVAVSGARIAVSAPFESSSAKGINGNQADSSAFGAGAAYVFW